MTLLIQPSTAPLILLSGTLCMAVVTWHKFTDSVLLHPQIPAWVLRQMNCISACPKASPLLSTSLLLKQHLSTSSNHGTEALKWTGVSQRAMRFLFSIIQMVCPGCATTSLEGKPSVAAARTHCKSTGLLLPILYAAVVSSNRKTKPHGGDSWPACTLSDLDLSGWF